MVFKGRFFSSKKSDSSSNSPDGSSNSPRSIGSNSPRRSDKKKAKSSSAPKEAPHLSGGGAGFASASRQTQVKDGGGGRKKKDLKGKETQSQPSTPVKSSSGSSSSLLNKVVAAAADVKDVQAPPPPPPPSSVSPILASSLGLNRIKTRSGPLPQESFFGFRGEKVSALGASNLSRPGGGGSGGDGSLGSGSSGKKEVGSHSKMGLLENASRSWGDNGSNSDRMSTGSAKSRDQSPNVLPPSRLQNGESSSEAGTEFDIVASLVNEECFLVAKLCKFFLLHCG